MRLCEGIRISNACEDSVFTGLQVAYTSVQFAVSRRYTLSRPLHSQHPQQYPLRALPVQQQVQSALLTSFLFALRLVPAASAVPTNRKIPSQRQLHHRSCTSLYFGSEGFRHRSVSGHVCGEWQQLQWISSGPVGVETDGDDLLVFRWNKPSGTSADAVNPTSHILVVQGTLWSCQRICEMN